jgi:hypothetical protein
VVEPADRPPLEPFDLSGAFAAREEQLAATLGMGKALTDHGTLVGTGTEHGWFGLLRGFLPGRYGVATGKVVDSMGRQSEQVDLIIYDTSTRLSCSVSQTRHSFRRRASTPSSR